jgi:predicted peptidase
MISRYNLMMMLLSKLVKQKSRIELQGNRPAHPLSASHRIKMRRLPVLALLIFLCGCGLKQTPNPIAALQQGCTSLGTILSSEVPETARGYPYAYSIYLPPCFSAESEDRYPVLYLVPGRGGAPDTWFIAGLGDVVDRMILSGEIAPFIIVATENIDSDSMAEAIYNDLIPHIEEKYPIAKDRKHHAVAGGSLGGVAAYRLAFQYPDTFSSAGIFGAGAISGEEKRIHEWLIAMDDTNRLRVFMDSGYEDPLMLDRAIVMKSILDEMGIENQLHSG